MHATEAESERLATFGGGIGSMLPMQQNDYGGDDAGASLGMTAPGRQVPFVKAFTI